MIEPVELSLVLDESRHGGKAVSLGRALRAGLPVPGGFGLDVERVDEVAHNPAAALDACERMLRSLGGRVAVRSSAIGEDARDASFAGQHTTILNAASAGTLADAIVEVRQSAHSASALAYRERMKIGGAPRIAVVVQKLVDAECAGVLFTRNPATGASERLIEAAWGLGETVVSGAVVPDSYRLDRDGRELERSIGVKDVALRLLADGGTADVAVAAGLVHQAVLTDSQLGRLHALIVQCESEFGEDLDIEWAFDAERLYLLQCRAITRTGR
ncbi:MAG: PEP/pyruvate-binding domain-containing protein [Candidatus Eisenbacteria bacterium]